jgi:hypothetical protein
VYVDITMYPMTLSMFLLTSTNVDHRVTMNVCAKTPCCITNVCGHVLIFGSVERLKNILPNIGFIVADFTADTLVSTCKGLMGCCSTRPQRHRGWHQSHRWHPLKYVCMWMTSSMFLVMSVRMSTVTPDGTYGETCF